MEISSDPEDLDPLEVVPSSTRAEDNASLLAFSGVQSRSDGALYKTPVKCCAAGACLFFTVKGVLWLIVLGTASALLKSATNSTGLPAQALSSPAPELIENLFGNRLPDIASSDASAPPPSPWTDSTTPFGMKAQAVAAATTATAAADAEAAEAGAGTSGAGDLVLLDPSPDPSPHPASL